MIKTFIRVILILLAVNQLGTGPMAQAQPPSREYAVKAAFLYNFAKFVQWPAASFFDDQTPLNVCILGEDPFGAAMQTIQNKTVRGRKLVVHRYRQSEDLEKCHLLFICRSEKEMLSDVLEALRNCSVLTVSDMDAFAERGGVIHFIQVDNKLRFEINLDAAERAALKISSRLLKLARIVRENPSRQVN